jgi:tetratricopeptide (TPR) repeat protein
VKKRKAEKPVACIVAKVVRAVGDFSQGELAKELSIDPRVLSARERNTKGTVPTREEIVEAVRAMGRPEGLVERTYVYARDVVQLFRLQSASLDSQLRDLADRLGATVSRSFYEASIAGSREMLARSERAIADSCWSHFSKLPTAARRPALKREDLFHRWGFAERLWRESLNAAADDAGRALELGEMAVLVAERVEGDEAPNSRLLGLAWSAVANARRVGGQLLQAERDFARAKGLWEAGEIGEPEILDEPRIHMMESALRVDQRRFPEALACIDSAFLAVKPGEDVAYLFIAKGNILFHLQHHEEAAATYLAATTKMGPFSSPRERFGTHFNLTACLIALGRAEQAEEHLPALRKMAVAIGNGLDLLRVRWLEGQALGGLGRRVQAVETLGEVRDVFLARENLWDAALVALERAAFQLEGGEFAEVKEEAPKLAEAFRSLGVAPELLASVSLFWSAAQAQMATAEQARVILSQLRQAGAPPAAAA